MNIVVTGASRGIGYQLVQYLAEDPSNTIIAVSRNAEKLARLKKESGPGRVIDISCDLSVDAEVASLTASLKEKVGTLDILINNAGAILNKPFSEIGAEEIRYVYEVNVFAVVRIVQQLLPLFSSEGHAHVVNIGSMGGYQGSAKFSGLSAYSSSKAALACLTECLAEELKEKNIAVNCLALGATQTEMLEEAFPGYKAPVTAEKMAEFIARFSLNGQHYMNGKILPVSRSTP